MALLIGEGVHHFANVTSNFKLGCQLKPPDQLVSLLLIVLSSMPVFCDQARPPLANPCNAGRESMQVCFGLLGKLGGSSCASKLPRELDKVAAANVAAVHKARPGLADVHQQGGLVSEHSLHGRPMLASLSWSGTWRSLAMTSQRVKVLSCTSMRVALQAWSTAATTLMGR